MEYTVLERFLKYVTIDTQSDPNSDTSPTTEKQKDLGRVLVQELQNMGITDAELDKFGYVYATIPAIPCWWFLFGHLFLLWHFKTILLRLFVGDHSCH